MKTFTQAVLHDVALEHLDSGPNRGRISAYGQGNEERLRCECKERDMRHAIIATDQRETAQMSPGHAGLEFGARRQNEIDTYPERVEATVARLGKSGGSTPNHRLSLCLGQPLKNADSEVWPLTTVHRSRYAKSENLSIQRTF